MRGFRRTGILGQRQIKRFRSSPVHVAPTRPPSPHSIRQPGAALSAYPAASSRSLSLLSFSALVRSYVITALTSTPTFLTPSLYLLSFLAHTKNAILSPDRNVILHKILKRTFYAHFCAGESPKEVEGKIQELKAIGFRGVILAYAKEIVLLPGSNIDSDESHGLEEISAWRRGTLETVKLVERGDCAALKFSGAGASTVQQLIEKQPMSQEIRDATTEICEIAKARGVGLLFDAEQHAIQEGIDQWILEFQRMYNKGASKRTVVYGTYQVYLRSTPDTLARHLAIAQKEGFTLGVKLVRGAYMGSDPRQLFWRTKAETDRAYDSIAEALIRREWNGILKPPTQDGVPPQFPNVSLVLASHNNQTVRKAMAIRKQQAEDGVKMIDMSYGHLMGMADEVSCELIMAGQKRNEDEQHLGARTEKPKVYKYVVWGTVSQCLKYLLRRAEENRDAVFRARESRIALRKELVYRLWGS
ncbi:MAG: hypothetical protein Q9167_000165 [Letrouitia subvulpina]